MTDMLADGLAWMREQQKTSVSRAVVYARGSDQATISATMGRSEFDVDEGNGILTRIESHDEIINVVDLVLASVKTEPSPGDTITVGTVVFRVSDQGPVPCWRFTDETRIAYRIHTKEVSR